MNKNYRILIASILLACAINSSLLAAAYTGFYNYSVDLDKAKGNTKQRLEVHLLYLRGISDKAVADRDAQKWIGLKEHLNTALNEYASFSKQGDANRDDQIRIGTALESLRQDILAGPDKVKKATLNQPAPKDIYKGKDKDAIKVKIKAKWKERYPDDQIVAIKFDKEIWERKKTKNWVDVGAYYQYIDVSTLTVRVIVKKDEETATIYGIYVQKDNDNPAKGAEVGPKGTFVPVDILLANVK